MIPSESIPLAALITGAGEPIGRAVALALCARGWAVALHGSTDAAVGAASAKGGRAVAVGADLTREDEVAALIPRATAAVGTLGLLVNSATLCGSDLVMTATRDSWDRHMETNLRAPFLLIQKFAHALPADAGGVVINLLDRHGSTLRPDLVSYSASKAGLWALTRSLALALAIARRIRVNAIEPGTRPEDVADAVRFILSTPSMTGQKITLGESAPVGWAPAGAQAALEAMGAP